jgi:hypothetical protein
MRSARQARYRCLLRLKGEKHHGVKSPLRDPIPGGWRPARTRRLGRLPPKVSRWPSGTVFYKRTTRLCAECTCALSQRVGAGASRALKRSLLKPSIHLNRRRRCSRWASPTSRRIAARPAVRRVRWRPTVDFLYHDRMRKSKPPYCDIFAAVETSPMFPSTKTSLSVGANSDSVIFRELATTL